MRQAIVLFLSVIAGAASALPSADDLRDMARRADLSALQAAFDAAQQQFRDGVADADDLRAMVAALAVTDPVIRQTMAEWLAADPASPQAATIAAFNRYEDAFALLGPFVSRETWTGALTAFDALGAEGTSLATAAYDAAPDFVPAADAVMLFQATMRQMTPEAFDVMLAAVRETTPNRGSLQRAAHQALPQWGGGGPVVVAALCERHALQVTDVPGYDVETCVIDLILAYAVSFGPDVIWQIAPLLMRNNNPIFDEDRLRLGLWPDPEGAEAALLAYLERETTTDIELAQMYDANHAIPQGLPVMMPVVIARNLAAARTGLQHDPYKRDLLLRLLDAARWDPTAPPPDPAEMLTLARDLVIAAPYDAEGWTRLNTALRRAGRGDDPVALSARINAVAFSNHFSIYLANLRGDLRRAARPLTESGFIGLSDDAAVDDLELTVCPLIRADRLFTAACTAPGEWDHACPGDAEDTAEIASLTADMAARGWCGWERTAPLADIAFLPVPVDLAAVAP